MRRSKWMLMPLLLTALITTGCLGGSSMSKPPAQEVYGLVTDKVSGQPLEGVMVKVNDKVLKTDENGTFSLAGLQGKVRFVAEKAGTFPVEGEFMADGSIVTIQMVNWELGNIRSTERIYSLLEEVTLADLPSGSIQSASIEALSDFSSFDELIAMIDPDEFYFADPDGSECNSADEFGEFIKSLEIESFSAGFKMGEWVDNGEPKQMTGSKDVYEATTTVIMTVVAYDLAPPFIPGAEAYKVEVGMKTENTFRIIDGKWTLVKMVAIEPVNGGNEYVLMNGEWTEYADNRQ